MHRFDKDGDGKVNVVEFTKLFFKMGFDERTRQTKERRDAEAVRYKPQELEKKRRRQAYRARGWEERVELTSVRGKNFFGCTNPFQS